MSAWFGRCKIIFINNAYFTEVYKHTTELMSKYTSQKDNVLLNEKLYNYFYFYNQIVIFLNGENKNSDF